MVFGPTAWAQDALGNLPAEVRAEDATITELGHATMTVEMKIVTDSLNRHTDTLFETKNIEWHTDPGTAKRRNAERERSGGSGFYNGDSNWWLDLYWYNFNYPSINAEGETVTLSALACMPDEDCDYINNVIIGCHVTITSNKECPSSYTDEGSATTDVSLLMNHAGSGLVFPTSQSNRAYYNLVIMPDYEGYGITRSHAHPYLYQELTARQVVDGVHYGIALYQSSPTIANIRHPFRSGWRSICVGYSQGGSVAMATQRFIEQNGLADELQLAGSVCGDGPYDPVATLMYYVKQYNDNKTMSMPVVLPLILKGMCDWNPYMKNHQVSDYLKDSFLTSGILGWLNQKEKTTDDITEAWETYFGDNWPLKLSDVINPTGLAFFQTLYTANSSTYTSTTGVPLPTQRGLMQDLQFALASNNLTKGWTPQHAMFLYHSYDDNVVPEDNRESAGNSFGQWVIKLHASGALQYDHVGTGRQFYVGTAEFAAIRELADAPVHQTLQDAIDMKDDIFTGAHTLDDWDNPPVINNGIVKGTVSLNGASIPAEYVLIGNEAHLGTGNNACISQYSVGKVEVPATITVDGTTYPVTEVSAMAFRMCNKVTEVTLPENVTRIGNFAFKGCQALFKVRLPSTVTSIGTGAFIDLPYLSSIDVLATTPPTWEYNDVFRYHTGGIGDNATYTYDNILLGVPENSIPAYQASTFINSAIGWNKAEGWGNFTHIFLAVDEDAEAYAVYQDSILTFYYDGNRDIREGTKYDLNIGEAFPGWHENASGIAAAVFAPSFFYARPTSTCKWFCDCAQLDTIVGWEYLHTDEVTDMGFMFSGCSRLTDDDIDFSNFVTTQVTQMALMFYGCSSLTRPDLSHFDTQNCWTFSGMFMNCSGLVSINLNSFVTRNCQDFSEMFYGCSNLEEVSIASFELQEAFSFRSMFSHCSKLKTMVIPTGIIDEDKMFINCASLEDVYDYANRPFQTWDNRNEFAPNKATRFHVLADKLSAWTERYPDANVTFVGDLGTETNPVLLYSTTDWENVRTMTQNDQTVNAKMMNDIAITTMMGSNDHPFMGTFDGNGHTLNVTMPDDYGTSHKAPFCLVGNATIKNLVVDGTIRGGIHSSGLVGYVANGSSLTIENCRVKASVSARPNISGLNINGPHIGGFVGHGRNATIAINGCLFDGTLETSETSSDSYAGVFIGWCSSKDGKTVTDCYETGTYRNYQHVGMNYDESQSASAVSMTNCYHNRSWGEAPHAYSLTTDTEGLTLDFGTPSATYDVSGITAYSPGLKLNGTFYAGTSQTFHIVMSAPGYEYSTGNLSLSGGATMSTSNNEDFYVTLASADAVISLPMTFTTIILHDDSYDNTLVLDGYVDKTYNVQLDGHTFYNNRWNPMCLPFDLSSNELGNSPLSGATLKVLDTITFVNKVALYHFKDTTAITADKPYLVMLEGNGDVESPTFNDVTVKRSLPSGMIVRVGEDINRGFSVMGNYNFKEGGELGPKSNYRALYLDDNNQLQVADNSTTLPAFNAFFEILEMPLDTVAAVVLDIENEDNIFTVLDDRFTDIDNIFVSDGSWSTSTNWAMATVPSSDDKVLVEGQATIPNGTIANVDEIAIDAGSITIEDGGQLKHSNAVPGTMQKFIAGYNDLSNPAGWYLLGAPLCMDSVLAVNSGMVDLVNDQADFDTHGIDLYEFNQNQDLEWRNMKVGNRFMSMGTVNNIAYLYARADDCTLNFSTTEDELFAPTTRDSLITVTRTGNGEFVGWNLISNPYTCNAYLASGRDFFRMNATGDAIVLATAENGGTAIKPCEGIFVVVGEHDPEQSASDSNTGYTTAARIQMTTTEPEPSGSKGLLDITVKQEGRLADVARVRFGNGDRTGKLVLRDNATRLSIMQDGKECSVVHNEAQGEMPVNFKAKENGTYTLTVNPEGVEMGYLHLIDNMTGADVDLLAAKVPEPVEGPTQYDGFNFVESSISTGSTTSYTFSAKTTDYESRFKLVFSANTEDGPSTPSTGSGTASGTFAFISDGNIVVNGEGVLQVIDMLGRELYSHEVAHSAFSIQHSAFPAGVYVLRLINGDDVKTQKMVIE